MDKSSHPHAAHIGGKFKNKIRRRPFRDPSSNEWAFHIYMYQLHTHTQAGQRRPLLTRPARINKPATAAWQDIGPTPLAANFKFPLASSHHLLPVFFNKFNRNLEKHIITILTFDNFFFQNETF
jgi:hypothetical protein